VLSAFAWPFATSRAKPAPIDSTSTLALGAVPSGWLYAYAMPADALRVRSIFTALGSCRRTLLYITPEYDPLCKRQVILTN
jgi:hypothetical protein